MHDLSSKNASFSMQNPENCVDSTNTKRHNLQYLVHRKNKMLQQSLASRIWWSRAAQESEILHSCLFLRLGCHGHSFREMIKTFFSCILYVYSRGSQQWCCCCVDTPSSSCSSIVILCSLNQNPLSLFVFKYLRFESEFYLYPLSYTLMYKRFFSYSLFLFSFKIRDSIPPTNNSF